MITALILAGGGGERLWPLSRKQKPKQFLKLVDKGKTMLELTVERLEGFIPPKNIFIATNKIYKEKVKNILTQVSEENIIVEPYKKNTAACIGLSTIAIENKFPNSIMVVLPADHFIDSKSDFKRILNKAITIASLSKNIVSIGIEPTSASTEYGYIHYGKRFDSLDEINIFEVKKFIEKPNKEKAKSFLHSGKYLWNSGIYIWKSSTILQKIELHMPELFKALKKIKSAYGTELQNKIMKEEFKHLDNISIDYGVIEKAKNIYVILAKFYWDDLGDWDALERVRTKDSNNNIIMARHVGIDTYDSLIYSENKLITSIGIKDTVIIETEDMILVCDKNRISELINLKNKLDKI